MRPIGAIIAGLAAMAAVCAGAPAGAYTTATSPFRIKADLDFHWTLTAPRAPAELSTLAIATLAADRANERMALSAPMGLRYYSAEEAHPHLSLIPAVDWCAKCADATGELALRVSNTESGLSVGAAVRLGEKIDLSSNDEMKGWQLFASADAQALKWSLGRKLEFIQDVRLAEMQVIGDAQVGIARDLYGGDLTVGFVHREYSYADASADEQFTGVTYVVTR